MILILIKLGSQSATTKSAGINPRLGESISKSPQYRPVCVCSYPLVARIGISSNLLRALGVDPLRVTCTDLC